MIVVDGHHSPPVRKTQGQYSEPPSPREEEQPPAYSGPSAPAPATPPANYQSTGSYQPQFYRFQYSQSPYPSQPPPGPQQQQYQQPFRPPGPPMSPSAPIFRFTPTPPRESTALRFIKAFLTALIIYLLLAILTRSIVDLAQDEGHRRLPHGGQWVRISGWDDRDWGNDDWPESPAPPPTLPNQHIVDCVQGKEWEPISDNFAATSTLDHARTAFDLPIDSALFLLSRGSMSHGALSIFQDEESQTGDEHDGRARVEVIVKFRTRTGLGRAQVCLMSRDDGGNGVGIFTPTRIGSIPYNERLDFEVLVHLPASSANSPVYIPSLETNMPLFAHALSELQDSFYFGALSLKTSNMPVEAKAVFAETINVQTTNGPIHGVYNASKSLDLITSNSVIDAAVHLYNDNDARSPSSLTMKTSNGPIKSTVSLHSTHRTSYYGNFSVTATTSNNILTLTLPESPADSALNLYAKTSNGPAQVTLPAAYEGYFSLSTSNMGPNVERRGNVEDPKGLGRRRDVQIGRVDRGSIKGTVAWVGGRSSGESGTGTVEVKTSNAPVRLIV